MKEFLRAKGFKMTPQREKIFRAFFEFGEHVTVDDLYDKVRKIDRSIGYSTVWRNLKLICQVGLAREVNIGDGVTRYDRATLEPHGHLFCLGCKKVIEFDLEDMAPALTEKSAHLNFHPESFKVEIEGYCQKCKRRSKRALSHKSGRRNKSIEKDTMNDLPG